MGDNISPSRRAFLLLFCFIWSTISQSNIKAKWKREGVGSVCCGVGRIEIHLKTSRSGIERAAATMKRRTSSSQPAVKSLCRQLAMRLVFFLSLGTFFLSQLRNKRRRDSFGGGGDTRGSCAQSNRGLI